MQELIDKLMIDVCKEGVSHEQVFFAFLCCWLYCYGLSKYTFFVCEGQPMKMLGFSFSGDQEKKSSITFNAGILRV